MKLLMHTCCGICVSYPALYLRKYFDLTLYYNNDNIPVLNKIIKAIINDVFGKDIARRVAGPMERADVSDPARAGAVPAVVASDRDPNAVRNVVRAVLHELFQRRLQRRNVNVERREVFRNATPNFFDRSQFGDAVSGGADSP